MPRQTKDTALPKPPAPPIDWVKIARSGKVWEFIEGEDFNGKVASFRARAKTAARKCGVDFESAEVKRGDTVVLKVLAHLMRERQLRAGASAQAMPQRETAGAVEAPRALAERK